MMKRWVLIGSTAGIILFLTWRAWFREDQAIDREMQWFVANLHYSFSGRVDSVDRTGYRDFKYLACRVTSGKCSKLVEDSLNHHLKKYRLIKFLFWNARTGQVNIGIGPHSLFKPGDSIVVNSDQDLIEVYGGREKIWGSKISMMTHNRLWFAFW